MTTLQIEYFMAVSKCLNFTQAAEEMYTSQPTISRQINLLEEELGVILFYRNKKSVKLTPAGVIMLRVLSSAMKQIENGIDEAHRANSGESGVIRIGYLDAINWDVILHEAILRFSEQYKNVTLEFERHSFKYLRESLNDGKLDIIFTFGFEAENLQEVNTANIAMSEVVVLMNEEHRLARKTNCTFKDFEGETFIMPSEYDSPGRRNPLDEIHDAFNMRRCRNIIYTPNLESVFPYVRAGRGITLVDKTIKYLNEPGYRYFQIPKEMAPPIPIMAAWKRENLNPIINVYISSIFETLDKEEEVEFYW